MSDWDVVGSSATSAPFQPVGGAPVNSLMPNSARVIATRPKAVSGAGTFQPATDTIKEQFPGAIGLDKTGKPVYAPAAAEAANLSSDGTDMLVDNYLVTSQLPNTGMGGLQIKTSVINGAADKLKRLGLTGADLAAQGAEFKANAKALGDAVTRRTAVAGFEGTVQDSIQLAQEAADKALSNTGFTTLNKAVNWYKGETSDPSYRQLQNATKTVTNEYAKVISNATNGGVTSDAARAHAEEMLSTADSPQAYKAAVEILQKEMQFRINSMDRQISGLSHSLHTALGSADGNGSGDYAAFTKAYQAKYGTVDGAQMAWTKYKQANPNTPWRQAFPEMKPAAAAPSAKGGNDPLGLRGN